MSRITHLLRNQTDVFRITNRVSDGQGGWAETWTKIASAVPCRMSSPGAGRDTDSAGQTRAFPGISAYFDLGTDIKANDHLLVAQPYSQAYRVVTALPEAEGTYLKASCEAAALVPGT